MFFTFPEDAHWNAEQQAVEFGVEIGEYRGVVRVPRRVFRRASARLVALRWHQHPIPTNLAARGGTDEQVQTGHALLHGAARLVRELSSRGCQRRTQPRRRLLRRSEYRHWAD